jgi:hypothetical protein
VSNSYNNESRSEQDLKKEKQDQRKTRKKRGNLIGEGNPDRQGIIQSRRNG